MPQILPPDVTSERFEAALRRFSQAIGEDWVLASDADRDAYLDAYAPGDAETYAPAAALAPATVEEVQEILRIANSLSIPLWPISRGKNLGYGGAAPVLKGSVVLDLVRMKRILEVNEKLGYVIVEPGVGFHDLFEHLSRHDINLWMSAPAQTWGSVMGNALDRGVGYTPYGDHAAQVCGLEVVLPDGELMRTGMLAMSNSACGPVFKHGFGPSWDGAFMQSNFGVVTKLALWMMPTPEATMTLGMHMPSEDDLGPVVDTLRPLRMQGVIQSNPSIGNAMRTIAIRSTREQWYQGSGAMPQDRIDAAMRHFGLGQWNFTIRLFGYHDVIVANANIIRKAFARVTQQPFETREWRRGEPLRGSGAAVPTLGALGLTNWRGGRGGHLTFSPILPADGAVAEEQYRKTRRRYEEFGFDYSGGFTAGERCLHHISMVIYDRNDAAMTRNARRLFESLIHDAAASGFGEYRTHVLFQDRVAAAYDFNRNALRRFNERVKDAIDPNGILAPGRGGIWPQRLREHRS